jgi:serine/threonine protein phosphatase PrpC
MKNKLKKSIRIKSLFCFLIMFFVSCSLVAVPGMELDAGFTIKNGRAGEDRAVAIPNLVTISSKGYSFFAVLDGHGGKEVVDFVAENLHLNFIGSEYFPHNIPAALEFAFKETDRLLSDKEFAKRCGTTAVVVVVTPEGESFIANLGDSRVKVFDGGRLIFRTTDHTPRDINEMIRVMEAGGSIVVLKKDEGSGQQTVQKTLTIREGLLVVLTQATRILQRYQNVKKTIPKCLPDDFSDRNVARIFVPIEGSSDAITFDMTRAFGDFHCKPLVDGERHYWISPEPSICMSRFRSKKRWILLASDGFWGIMDYNRLDFKKVISNMMRQGKSAQQISEALANKAREEWEKCLSEERHCEIDDITVLLVKHPFQPI